MLFRREWRLVCVGLIILVLCFFFSSRRRHTRWTGDWSSDVCSSDLTQYPVLRTGQLGRSVCSKATGEGRTEALARSGEGHALSTTLPRPHRSAAEPDRKSVV